MKELIFSLVECGTCKGSGKKYDCKCLTCNSYGWFIKKECSKCTYGVFESWDGTQSKCKNCNKGFTTEKLPKVSQCYDKGLKRFVGGSRFVCSCPKVKSVVLKDIEIEMASGFKSLGVKPTYQKVAIVVLE